MSYRVGTKGQVVIDHEIREALGVAPGWLAAQRLVDDHVEIRFFPPEHDRSLLGILADAAKRRVSLEKWPEARERAWAEAAAEKEMRAKASKEPASKPARKKTTRG
jgi:bifunctional DNA-binding transcriptional regulator/antitoxin component of YhaV-PrlF toxin-antitoxin module